MTAVEILLVIPYFVVLGVLCSLGAHRAYMVYLSMKHAEKVRGAARHEKVFAESELPLVTIQLPLYNEATVAARLLDATAAMDYPRDRLEIQVLDDSSDETRAIAEAKVRELRAQGINIHYVRRPNRHGYKAGALDYGLSAATGEFVAVFDADFVPQRDFLRQVIHHFTDEKIGMVQTRWAHLNRDANLLTSVQALMLDGHHLVENTARYGADCFFNFAGTGGIWRRTAIEAAGGWEHDTLTEDLDLSYRAQMAGFRFVYRPDVLTPSELPEDMSALRAQQFRWAKGTVQTARKLLPKVMNSDLPLHIRVEAAFHMLPHFAYPLMLSLSVLLFPALVLLPASDLSTMFIVDAPLCFGATGSLAAFYMVAERAQGRSAWGAVKRLPVLIAVGAGLSPHLSGAVFSGVQHMAGEFVRTPKKGENATRYRQRAELPYAETVLGLLCVASAVAAVKTGHWFAAPFALLFAWGYGYVASQILKDQFARSPAALPVPQASEAPLAKAA